MLRRRGGLSHHRAAVAQVLSAGGHFRQQLVPGIGRRPIFWGWKTSSRPRRRYDERQQYRGQSFFTARGTPSAEKNVIISKRRRVSVSGVTQVRDGSSPSEKATHAFAGSPGNSCSGLSAQWGLCELPNPQGVLISSPVKVSNRASVRGHRVAFERPGPTVILKVQCFSFLAHPARSCRPVCRRHT